MGATATVRRTQAERTATTRAALLDATVDCLAELGYAGATTTEIARRAGVSRGAQLHHFPTKQDLVVAAVEHLYERRTVEFRSALAGVTQGPDRLDAAVDVLWSIISGPTFAACLEVNVAARTDDVLRRRFEELDARFHDGVKDIFAELFPRAEGADPAVWDLAPGFTFAVLEGLALRTLHGNDLDFAAEAIDALKMLARLLGLGGDPEQGRTP